MLVVGGLVLVARRRAPVTVLAVTGVRAGLPCRRVRRARRRATWSRSTRAVRAGHRIATVAASVIMLAAVPLTILATHHGWTVGEALTQSRDVLAAGLADRRRCGGRGAATGRAASRGGRTQPRGDRPAPRRRGAAAHRAGAARLAHPPDLGDQGAGRGRRPPGPQAGRTGAGVRCWPSGRPDGRRPGNCGRPWRRSATTTRPRPSGSTTFRIWCTRPGRPVWTRS